MDAGVMEFSKRIEAKFHSQMKWWRKQKLDPMQWAWESHQQALDFAYGRLPARITVERPVSIADCTGDNNISARMLSLHESVDENYLNAISPAVEQQLAKAAARLALTLTRLWH